MIRLTNRRTYWHAITRALRFDYVIFRPFTHSHLEGQKYKGKAILQWTQYEGNATRLTDSTRWTELRIDRMAFRSTFTESNSARIDQTTIYKKLVKKSFGQHAVWSIGIPPVEQATSFPWRHLILYRICKILIEGKTKRIPSEWLKHRRTKKFVPECGTHVLKVVGSNPGIIHWLMLYFTYICCKNCNDVCLKRLKINDKKGRGWPVF